MATKTLFDELDEILTAEDKLALQILKKNPTLATRLEDGDRLLKMYLEANPEPEVPATPPPAPTTPPVARPAVPTTAAAPALGLDDISKLLDTKLTELRKEFVPAAELDKRAADVIGTSLRLNHELSRIENAHQKEFNEELDLGALETYAKEHPGFKSMTEVHNAMVAEKRIEARIKAGVDAGVKQKLSNASVPAQTKGSALTPAQEVLAKARASASGEGKSNAVAAAEKLAKMVRDRESAAD
jgi:hypothetical protein